MENPVLPLMCARIYSIYAIASSVFGRASNAKIDIYLLSNFEPHLYWNRNWQLFGNSFSGTWLCMCLLIPDWAGIWLNWCEKSRVSLTFTTAAVPRLWHLHLKPFIAVIISSHDDHDEIGDHDNDDHENLKESLLWQGFSWWCHFRPKMCKKIWRTQDALVSCPTRWNLVGGGDPL